MGSTPIPSSMTVYIDFHQYLKQHIREVTVVSYLKRLDRLSRITDLDNTENVKNIICSYQCTESYKELLTNAYAYWVAYKRLQWDKPKFLREDKPIFVPLESELDELIARPRLKMSGISPIA
jgi:hypothetical protein